MSKGEKEENNGKRKGMQRLSMKSLIQFYNPRKKRQGGTMDMAKEREVPRGEKRQVCRESVKAT